METNPMASWWRPTMMALLVIAVVPASDTKAAGHLGNQKDFSIKQLLLLLISRFIITTEISHFLVNLQHKNNPFFLPPSFPSLTPPLM